MSQRFLRQSSIKFCFHQISSDSLPIRDLGVVRKKSKFETTYSVDKIRFESKIYLHVGRYMPIPDPHNLPEHKVKGCIDIDDLGLDELGQARLAYMAGLRYNPNKRVLKITCEYFPIRIENRRWIIYTIEQLRRAAMEPDFEFDPMYMAEEQEKLRKRMKNKRPASNVSIGSPLDQ